MAPKADILIFDVGKVLFEWDLRHLFSKLICDSQELDWFLSHVVTADWHFQADEGRDVADMLAERTALFPQYAPLIRAYGERFNETIPFMISGMDALMKRIIASQIPLYAITNFGAEFWAAFRPAQPLFDHFTDVIVSGVEKLAKPEPAIFKLAKQRFGIDPARCLFIDDRADNVAAAEACGFQGHVFIDAERLETNLIALGLLTISH